MTSPDTARGALDDFLCFGVYSTGLAFNRLYKPLLDRYGLTYPQYLVMVALDENERPAPVPGLILETEQEKRDWAQGEARKAARKAQSR